MQKLQKNTWRKIESILEFSMVILTGIGGIALMVLLIFNIAYSFEYEMYSVLFSKIFCYSLFSIGSVTTIIMIIKFRKFLRFGKTAIFSAFLILVNFIFFSAEYLIYLDDKMILNEQNINNKYISEQTDYLIDRQQYFEKVELSYKSALESIETNKTYPIQILSKNILFLNIASDTVQFFVGYKPRSSGVTWIEEKKKTIEGDYLTLRLSSQEVPNIFNSRSLKNSRELITLLNDSLIIDGTTLKNSLLETTNYFSDQLSKTKTAIIEVGNRGIPFHYFIMTTFNRQDSFKGNLLIRFLLVIHIIVSAFIAGYIANRCYKFFDRL